ncbi:uncharacterized protein PHACADRAFT_183040 [Phanerochaete carnosa HHB-10118-sp]|uniref:Uncharacterized protein n=1 Tax=Phanerochaete carnosa (strain HHB-10118-sp) TaxID=650164 RepID=K5X0P2_PHACS|nr:uncharacterized protein PHACADRAFT_183040 [Phanerochaete carnosa HHB-10118-sp]EKM56307.1 hypothetical protein PHACADRAFT_183040 [Phanerochaete carnosa HHB-10118-sp]
MPRHRAIRSERHNRSTNNTDNIQVRFCQYSNGASDVEDQVEGDFNSALHDANGHAYRHNKAAEFTWGVETYTDAKDSEQLEVPIRESDTAAPSWSTHDTLGDELHYVDATGPCIRGGSIERTICKEIGPGLVRECDSKRSATGRRAGKGRNLRNLEHSGEMETRVRVILKDKLLAAYDLTDELAALNTLLEPLISLPMRFSGYQLKSQFRRCASSAASGLSTRHLMYQTTELPNAIVGYVGSKRDILAYDYASVQTRGHDCASEHRVIRHEASWSGPSNHLIVKLFLARDEYISRVLDDSKQDALTLAADDAAHKVPAEYDGAHVLAQKRKPHSLKLRTVVDLSLRRDLRVLEVSNRSMTAQEMPPSGMFGPWIQARAVPSV